jgi:preprotein translocase subunit SecA
VSVSVAGGGSTLAGYAALFETLRARRRAAPVLRGPDQLVAWAGLKLRQRSARLARLMAWARQVEAMTPALLELSEVRLDEAMLTAREAVTRGRADHAQIVHALALVREVARRETGEQAYSVQIAGALALLHGRIAEMATGEGKTLTGSLAVPILAWRFRHVHVLTVNDYLAQRDAGSREGLYRRCGLTVAAVTEDLEEPARAGRYAGSVVYGTPKQIAADYLRDQIRLGRLDSAWSGWHTLRGGGPIVPGLHACLVDEADAVLIDEGVTPLIIARPRETDEQGDLYREARQRAELLTEGEHYSVDTLRRRVELTRAGEAALIERFGRERRGVWALHRRGLELVRQALTARHLYLRGRHYELVEGRVVIVDQYTGRLLPDRSWEYGLHQSVEAKEGVEVTADRETLARISFQRFFRSYRLLCGMTGTASDAAGEMERVYGRPVTVIPTHRPVARVQRPTRVFRTTAAKWSALVQAVHDEHCLGRPVLIGTPSVEASQHLSGLLAEAGLAHTVLNALHHADEAATIAHAGEAGRITVATNMAGRGTDIRLSRASREAGGLHVILTELHGARRIDRQFIGRAGRQGDPGSAQIFASLADDLPDRLTPRLSSWLSRRERAELTGGLLPRVMLRLAQRRGEARDRRGRSVVLRQDDWIERYLPR